MCVHFEIQAIMQEKGFIVISCLRVAINREGSLRRRRDLTIQGEKRKGE